MDDAEQTRGSLLESLINEAEKQTDAPAEPSAGAGSSPAGGGPDAGSLSSLPALLSLIGPVLSGTPGRGSPAGAGPGPSSKRPDRHTALLKALKPYLSPARRSAVETLLSVAGMWDALSGVGGLPAGERGPSSSAPAAAQTAAANGPVQVKGGDS